MTDDRRCEAIRADGGQCRASPLPGDRFCFAHSPTLAQTRAEARERGGRNSSRLARATKAAPTRLSGVADLLEAALGEVRDGTLSPGRAQAMASLARALVTVVTGAETEQRVAELVAALDDVEARLRDARAS